MNDWHDELRQRRSVITLRPIAIPVLWLALALSLLVHLTALWEWLPRLDPLLPQAPGTSEKSPASTPIVARLGNPQPPASAPPPSPPPAVATPPPAPVEPRPRPPRPPPVIARTPRVERPVVPPAAQSPLSVPPPDVPPAEARFPPPAPPVAAPRPPPPEPSPQPPIAGDLASYIASRRRARGASEPAGTADGAPTDTETERRDRIVASNLASVNTRNFNDGPKNSGGVFQIVRIGYDDAEFAFFGWNRDIKRRANMRIEVRRSSDDADVRHAVVRKMISIIREYEVEDFTWESLRLGRNVRLSARQRDTAELEAFLMREFFEGPAAR